MHDLTSDPAERNSTPGRSRYAHSSAKLELSALRDLAADLCGRMRPMATEPVPSVSVLLIDAKDQGHTATLVMELVSPGEGHIYPRRRSR